MSVFGLEVVRELDTRCGETSSVLIKPIAPTELRRRLTAAAVALETMQATS